jgi:putative endonuclease
MYHSYILFSQKLDKYYIGSTGDLSGRLHRHNSAHKGFTGTGQPWKLVYSEPFSEKSLAFKREMELKSWKNRKKLEELIKSDQNSLSI